MFGRCTTFVFVMGPLLVLVGCASTAKDWDTAKAINTPEAYEQFIANHPDDERVTAAEAAIEAMAWAEAKQDGSPEAMREFLRAHPASELATQATDAIETSLWQQVRSEDTISSYLGYLRKSEMDPLIGANNVEARKRVEGFIASATPMTQPELQRIENEVILRIKPFALSELYLVPPQDTLERGQYFGTSSTFEDGVSTTTISTEAGTILQRTKENKDEVEVMLQMISPEGVVDVFRDGEHALRLRLPASRSGESLAFQELSLDGPEGKTRYFCQDGKCYDISR